MADVTWLIGSMGILAVIILCGIAVLWKHSKRKNQDFQLQMKEPKKSTEKHHTTRCCRARFVLSDKDQY